MRENLSKKRVLPALGLALAAAVALAPILSSAASAEPDDWPQWRGPNRNGQSAETGLLREWPQGGPPLAWRSSGLGSGYSSMAVSGNRILTLGDSDGSQYAVAVSREDGSPLWKTRVGPPWQDQYGGPRSTPTTDGDRVYVLGTEGDLLCMNVSDGEVRWRKSLTRDFSGRMAAGRNVHWKFAESPLVDGNKVIVSPGSQDAGIVALDKMNGNVIWRASIPEIGSLGADGAAYSSAVVSQAGGVRQYVQLTGRGVVSVDAATGRFLWGYNRVANDVANIATPIVDGDHVFVSTGYGTGSALLKIERQGDRFEAQEVYFLGGRTLQNHHGGMILHEGHIYTGTGHNRGLPICVEMSSGSVVWGPERNRGRRSAAVTFADGHLYFRYENGLMVLIEATTQGYREKGSFMIPEVDQFSWSHPVVAGGMLYLREQDKLFAYNISRR